MGAFACCILSTKHHIILFAIIAPYVLKQAIIPASTPWHMDILVTKYVSDVTNQPLSMHQLNYVSSAFVLFYQNDGLM